MSAVSRAFTDGASISPAMRAKVDEAALALGYRPNLIARSLITGRTKLIGVAAGNLENGLFTYVLDLLSMRLAEAGFQMMLYTSQPDPAVNEAQLDEFLRYKLHGMFLLAVPLPEALLAHCRREGVPIVFFNQPAQGEGNTLSIQSNNAEGARQIARFLVEAGHQRIAVMTGDPEARASEQREAAFNAELARLGAPLPLREIGLFRHAGAMEAARRLLSRPDRPDAIFCVNDQMALATIAVAQGEFGLKIGRELSVVGFGDAPMAGWPNFALTTYALPIPAMVDQAVAFLIGNHAAASGRREVRLPGQLIIRKSTPSRIHRKRGGKATRST